MRILITHFFNLKDGSIIKGHSEAVVKEQCRLEKTNYSFFQRIRNDWNKLSHHCGNANIVNTLKYKTDRYLARAVISRCRTIDKPKASLSTHRLVALHDNLFVKSC